MASSGSVFGETLKTITTAKLDELAKQRAAFDKDYAALLDAVNAKKGSLERVFLLADGTKACLGVKTGGTRNTRLEIDLKNLERFLEQARFDPSVSPKILEDWEKTLLQYLSVQSTKFQYADLYGKLVTEWLASDKPSTNDGDVEMTESFEELPGAKRLASRSEWEKDVFQSAEVDEQTLKTYLDELFITNKKEGAAAIRELRNNVENFESRLNSSTQFDKYTLRSTIQGLQNSDLLSNEKREALNDFLSNDVILKEICDILNIRLKALDRWTWGSYVMLEQRRKLNGDFTIHFDPDLLQAIFLHYLGVKWSVFFKSAFLDIHHHDAWTNGCTEVSKVDRLRRSYYLGDQVVKASPSLEKKRESIHHNRYFAHQLLDYDEQEIKAEEGEEEAEYGDFVNKKRKSTHGLSLSSQKSSTGRTKQTARKSTQRLQNVSMSVGSRSRFLRDRISEECVENDIDFHNEEVYTNDDEDEQYRRQAKQPMEAKQSLLHLASTEIIVNTRLHGELTCFRTTFDSWNPILPHQTIFAVLEFLGVSEKWMKLFKNYLQAPLKFMDDPSAGPRLRRRGMPGSHALSDMLGEAVLFCLDFAVNQATEGDLWRLGDEAWFWNPDYDKCASAWATVLKFTEVMGVKLDEKKTGSVRISHDKNLDIDDRLPDGEIRWGFLQLDPKSGRFEIDQEMVDGHVEELRTQLKGKSKSVIDYIQVWNSYAATFFSSNFGKASNCFGREHIDKMLSTHRHIQNSIYPGSSIVQHLRTMIEERFLVKNVPDGFLFFPVELGGLDLKSPFVPLLQIRKSVKENPYALLDEFEENEHEDYETLKRKFDKGDIRPGRRSGNDANWKPSDSDTFLSFDEFIKYREAFASIGKANLLNTYAELLKRPREEPVEVSDQVEQALADLADYHNSGGIKANFNSMDAYWKWITQMYGPEMIDTFGGLNVVDFGLLPIGMVSMFRQRRTKWQG